MVVLSAAIKGVSTEIIEAARLDGATERQIFFRVIVPIIKGSIITVVDDDRHRRAEDLRHRLRHDRRPLRRRRGRQSHVPRDVPVLQRRTRCGARNDAVHSGACRSCTSTYATSDDRRWKHDRNSSTRREGGRARQGLATAAAAQRTAAHQRSSRSASCGRSPRSGLLVTSFRDPLLIANSGWWTSLLNPFAPGQWTLSNYQQVLANARHGQRVPQQPDRDHPVDAHPDHDRSVRGVRVRVDPVPAVAASCSRSSLRLLVVPIQMSLIPILSRSTAVPACTARSWASGWRIPAFGLPLAIFLLYNFMSQLPRDLFESAAIDGASHSPDLHPDRRCRCRSRPSAHSRSSSSCGSGTTCSSRSIFLGVNADLRVMPTALFAMLGSIRRPVAAADRRRVHHHDVPLIVFLVLQRAFVTRDPGRLGQVTAERLMVAFAGTERSGRGGRRRSRSSAFAGVTLFRDHNVTSVEQVRALNASLQNAARPDARPLLIAADQEGGQLNALGDGPTAVRGRDGTGSRGRYRPESSASREPRPSSYVRWASTSTTCPCATSRRRPTTRRWAFDPSAIRRSCGRASMSPRTSRGLQAEGVAAAASSTFRVSARRRPTHITASRSWTRRSSSCDRARARSVPSGDRGRRDAWSWPGTSRCPSLTGDSELPASLARSVLTDLLRDELGFAA